MKRVLLAFVVLGLLSGISLAAPTEEASKNPERVLAKVDKQEIKEKDIDQVIQMIGPQGAMMYDNEQGRRAILDELVAARLFALQGAKQGLEKTPAYKEALESFRNQTLARMAIEASLEKVTATSEEAKKFYDENPAQFVTPEEVRARHILISDDVSSTDTIKKIQESLKKGVSFDVLAKEFSIDPGSAQQGGDLGFFPKGQMIPEFEAAAFGLAKPGDISEPVKTNYGWHIIQLEERKPSSTIALKEVEPQIIQYLANEKKTKKYQEELDALKKQYKVEILLPEPAKAEASADKK